MVNDDDNIADINSNIIHDFGDALRGSRSEEEEGFVALLLSGFAFRPACASALPGKGPNRKNRRDSNRAQTSTGRPWTTLPGVQQGNTGPRLFLSSLRSNLDYSMVGIGRFMTPPHLTSGPHGFPLSGDSYPLFSAIWKTVILE